MMRCGIRIRVPTPTPKKVSFLGPVAFRLGQVLLKRMASLPHLAALKADFAIVAGTRICLLTERSPCQGLLEAFSYHQRLCELVPRPNGASSLVTPRLLENRHCTCWAVPHPALPWMLSAVENPGPRRADRGYAGDGFALMGAAHINTALGT